MEALLKAHSKAKAQADSIAGFVLVGGEEEKTDYSTITQTIPRLGDVPLPQKCRREIRSVQFVV